MIKKHEHRKHNKKILKLPKSSRIANGTVSSGSVESEDDSDFDSTNLMKGNKKTNKDFDSASIASGRSNTNSTASKVTLIS